MERTGACPLVPRRSVRLAPICECAQAAAVPSAFPSEKVPAWRICSNTNRPPRKSGSSGGMISSGAVPFSRRRLFATSLCPAAVSFSPVIVSARLSNSFSGTPCPAVAAAKRSLARSRDELGPSTDRNWWANAVAATVIGFRSPAGRPSVPMAWPRSAAKSGRDSSGSFRIASRRRSCDLPVQPAPAHARAISIAFCSDTGSRARGSAWTCSLKAKGRSVWRNSVPRVAHVLKARHICHLCQTPGLQPNAE